VLAAIREDRRSIHYASEILKRDEDIIQAIEKSRSVEYASEILKKDGEIIQTVEKNQSVEKDPESLLLGSVMLLFFIFVHVTQ